MDPRQDSGLSTVLQLVDDFSRTGETNTLKKLSALVINLEYGANAAAGLQRLKASVDKEDIKMFVLPALIGGLDSSSPSTRRQCAIALADEFNPFAMAAIPALCRVATNAAESVNAAPFAVEALGKLGNPASNAIPVLIEILDHRESESGEFQQGSVRVKAAQALGDICASSEAACRRLEQSCLDANLYLRAEAAVSLLRIGCMETSSISTLTSLLSAEDVEIRRFAVGEIGRLNPLPTALVDLLKRRLHDSDPEIAAAARRILGRGPNNSRLKLLHFPNGRSVGLSVCRCQPLGHICFAGPAAQGAG
jgi:hypothetical protein